MKNNKKVIVILGPTSSGKSEVAIQLAQKFKGEIISADSRQVYKGMDIGTGKIRGAWSVKRGAFMSDKIPHYMIDIVSPRTDYNVAKFKKDAEKIIEDILKRGKVPIICGGTGFWIKAIVDDVNFPQVKPNKELRKKLEKYSAEKLFKILEKLDSERAKDIDRHNGVRLIRAIEICKTLGSVPKIQNTKYDIRDTKYDFLQIGIDISKEELHKNIEKRLKKRFEAGMIKEVEELHEQGLSWKKIQSFGLGYYWIPLYLKQKIDRKDLFEKVLSAEKDYAKRQMTWFRKDNRIICLKNYKDIEKEVNILL